MNKHRKLPAVMKLPTRSRGRIKCLVMSEVHVATITLRDAGSFAMMTIDDKSQPCGAAILMTLAEVEAIAELLRLAAQDAERADRGEPLKNTPASELLQ